MLDYYDAIAEIAPSSLAPDLSGTVKFLDTDGGTWVEAEIFGLPEFMEGDATHPQIGPFGFHIHENAICGEQFSDEPFTAAGAHWNPTDQPHGNHAGDLPSLFSNDGVAKMLFFTNKFKPKDVINKTVIIHQSPDDFQTQPSGKSGKRIGCGTIVASELAEDFTNI